MKEPPGNHDPKSDPCFHGGAFFDAIGDEFDALDRRQSILNADVLDAWFPPSPRVIEALQADLGWILRTSPPTDCGGMIRVLARARGVDPAAILPGAGSSALIFLAFREWLTPASRVLVLDPTYGEYGHVLENVVGCQVRRCPLARENDFRPDLQQLRRLAEGCDWIVMVNPNSPTGCHVPRAELESWLADLPPWQRVWIDETYVEYASEAAGTGQSLEPFAARSDHVVVCKSMSKVYALSGARAAYLCGPPAMLADLRRLTPPWAVSLVAQIAAVHAIEDREYYTGRYRQTRELREALVADLRRLDTVLGSAGTGSAVLGQEDRGQEDPGQTDRVQEDRGSPTSGRVAITPSVANFVLCEFIPAGAATALPAAPIVEQCREHGVFLRDTSGLGMELGNSALRIAVKAADDNARIVAALRRVLPAMVGEAAGIQRGSVEL